MAQIEAEVLVAKLDIFNLKKKVRLSGSQTSWEPRPISSLHPLHLLSASGQTNAGCPRAHSGETHQPTPTKPTRPTARALRRRLPTTVVWVCLGVSGFFLFLSLSYFTTWFLKPSFIVQNFFWVLLVCAVQWVFIMILGILVLGHWTGQIVWVGGLSRELIHYCLGKGKGVVIVWIMQFMGWKIRKKDWIQLAFLRGEWKLCIMWGVPH